ncbi:hypothetical protein F8M41_003194 [Gigaspora margarita]|uniref:Uncharacterized protein n=1 Tax=Gigaspora margarita TaxID=4874 RepID=A0A8H4AY84_GIGMA|nr:hypothetical protein F8M41_003194 [Gigaspora margarita]
MPKDQFQGSIVQSMNMGIKDDRIDRIILVSKMDNKKKDVKSDNLSKLNREVIWNTEYKKGQRCNTVSEVEDMNKCIDIAKSGDNKINNLLFNPEESVFSKTKVTKLESKINSYLNSIITTCDIFYIYTWKHKIKEEDCYSC